MPKDKGSGCFDVQLDPDGGFTCLPPPPGSSCPRPLETCRNYTQGRDGVNVFRSTVLPVAQACPFRVRVVGLGLVLGLAKH